MGGQKVRQTCSELAEKLRLGEPEEIRISFYISTELMLGSPNDEIHLPFLNYLEECSR